MSICSIFFTFVQVQRKKAKTKKLGMQDMKNYAQTACNIQCISTLSKENNISEKSESLPKYFLDILSGLTIDFSSLVKLLFKNDVT